MSLKSLMSQRKAAARLQHPYAKYDHVGKLSCALCGTQLKHENLWSAHLVSKQHRVKAASQQATTTTTTVRGDEEAEEGVGSKRKRVDEEDESGSKRVKNDAALPDDFFSVPDEQQKAHAVTMDEDDPEWAAFEAELAVTGPATTTTTTEQDGSKGLRLPPVMKSTAGATLSAQPVAYEFGAPKVTEAAEEATERQLDGDEQEEETEEEKRERLEREEREEMLERINEEERAQQEADDRVTALQQKMKRLKEMRAQKQQQQPRPNK